MKEQITNKLSRGFTLIELLVVIAILGVLAAALLAAIDPLEQIRKSQDSNYKATSVEYANALARYYATKNANPWDAAPPAGTGDGCNAVAAPGWQALNTAAMVGCTGFLIAQGELKPGFANIPYLSKIFIMSPNPNTTSVSDSEVCFQPTSKSQILDPNTKYSKTTGVVGCVQGAGNPNNCHWCTQ